MHSCDGSWQFQTPLKWAPLTSDNLLKWEFRTDHCVLFSFSFFLPFWRWLSEFDLDECETRLDLFFIHLAIFELHQWAKVVISNIHWQTSNLIPGDKSQSAQQRVIFFFSPSPPHKKWEPWSLITAKNDGCRTFSFVLYAGRTCGKQMDKSLHVSYCLSRNLKYVMANICCHNYDK